jgi:hypothetical protein
MGSVKVIINLSEYNELVEFKDKTLRGNVVYKLKNQSIGYGYMDVTYLTNDEAVGEITKEAIHLRQQVDILQNSRRNGKDTIDETWSIFKFIKFKLGKR